MGAPVAALGKVPTGAATYGRPDGFHKPVADRFAEGRDGILPFDPGCANMGPGQTIGAGGDQGPGR
jgi:hypothetical protein